MKDLVICIEFHIQSLGCLKFCAEMGDFLGEGQKLLAICSNLVGKIGAVGLRNMKRKTDEQGDDKGDEILEEVWGNKPVNRCIDFGDHNCLNTVNKIRKQNRGLMPSSKGNQTTACSLMAALE